MMITHLNRILGLFLVAPLVVTACAVAPAGPSAAVPIAVRTAPAATATISGTVAYSGNVASRDKVGLLPKIAGQVTILNVDVGSAVKMGDVVAELDHAALDAQVAQAQAGVEVARAKLATIRAGSRPETIAQAKANLAAAQAALAFLQSGGRAENVQAAQGNLDAAVARVSGLETPRPEAVAQAQANLGAAQAKLQALKAGPTPQQLAVAQQAVEAAKDAAYAANVNKDGACNPRNPRYQCDAAQAQADAAATTANQAQAQLNVLTSPPTAEQLRQAQAAVDAASAQLRLAQHPGSASDVAAAQGAVAAARAARDLAKQPASSADLAKAQAAVDVAEQQLKLAEQPYTPQDEAAAKAAVDQARAALAAAQVARDQAIVRAPIDGVVAQRLLAVGAMAAPTTPIVTLVDPRVDVLLQIDEASADLLKVGQSATVTSEALPGKTVAATVAQVAPVVDPQTRAVQVKVTPTDPNAVLKDGMLVQVAIVTATHEGALVVPAAAVVQRNGQPTVYVVANGTATPRGVATGLADGTRGEITRGLTAGDQVVVSGQDRLMVAQLVAVEK